MPKFKAQFQSRLSSPRFLDDTKTYLEVIKYVSTFLLAFATTFTTLDAQTTNGGVRDSIHKVFTSAQHDSTKVIAYFYLHDKVEESTGGRKRAMLLADSIVDVNLNHDLDADESRFFQRSKAIALKGIAYAFQEEQQYDTAKILYQRSIELSQSGGFAKITAMALNNLGMIYYLEGQYQQTIELFKKSFHIMDSLGELRLAASAANNIGVLLNAFGNKSEAISYYQRSIKIRNTLNDSSGMISSLNNVGSVHYEEGRFDSAIANYTQSLDLAKAINDTDGVARAYNNVALVYQKQGNYQKAADYLTRNLRLTELRGDSISMAMALNNLGNLNKDQGNYKKAIELYSRSLQLKKSFKNKAGVSISSFSLGQAYFEMDVLDSAEAYFKRSLEIDLETGNRNELSKSLTALGNLAVKKGAFEEAEGFYKRALDIQDELDDPSVVASLLSGYARLRLLQKRYQEAIDYGEQAIATAAGPGILEPQRSANSTLWKSYEATGQFKRALEAHQEYILVRDSIQSEKNQREIVRQEFKYQYDKQAAADSIKAIEAQKVANAQIAAQKAQLEQEKTQRYALFGGVGFLALFGGFMFNRFQVTSRQKDIIKDQKEEVEEAHEQLTEKNKEILDSIEYAKRIQTAILPPDRIVKEFLEDSFILYKPKDVVAGDFYWMESVDETVYFAAADCTGHGVPGAMVSVICVNGLNRSVREFGLREPGEILDKTRDLVIKEFEKSEEDVKDGMDISLCALNTTTNELKWAGAHNPLWIVRANSDEIEEIKADKQPIGKFELAKPFTTHKVKLHQGDTIYTFSDGYPDQFGGDRGKKYKSGKFKRTLISLSQKEISEQRTLLDEEFEAWRGEIEQIDDVCVMGVRV